MKILTDKYPDYKRVILDVWATKVAVSSTDFMALIDSIACEHPMHFMPFQGPSVILLTSFPLNIAVENPLATGRLELRQVSPLGSLVLS